jgi:hypothetical protein
MGQPAMGILQKTRSGWLQRIAWRERYCTTGHRCPLEALEME